MIDWYTFDEEPPEPVQVEYYFGNLPMEFCIEPYRDERRGLGYWDGEVWRDCGTGHDFSDRRERMEWLPTHWRPLPPIPSLFQEMNKQEGTLERDRRDDIINHFRDEKAVAAALSITLTGDDASRQEYTLVARRFLDQMEKSMLAAVHA